MKNRDAITQTNSNKLITHLIYACSALSLDVYYKSNDPKRPSLPHGWIRFEDSGDDANGYVGACYIRNPDNPSCIIFAHRGTTLNELTTNTDDIETVLNNCLVRTPSQFASAQKFVNQTEQTIANTYPGLDIERINGIHTGYALGGVLAELLATTHTIAAITFENPGTKPIILKLLREQHLSETEIQEKMNQLYKMCLTYRADVNLLNSFNEQVGEIFCLVNLPYHYDDCDREPKLIIPPKATQNLYYLAYSTNDQHKLDLICQYLKNKGVIIKDKNPVGIQEGYVAYLDVDTRLNYWRGYFKFIWDEHKEIRQRYNDIIEIYLADSFHMLKSVQARARKLGEENIDIQKGTAKLSQLGLFKQSPTIDINDFVLVDSNNPSCDSQENYKIEKCLIM